MCRDETARLYKVPQQLPDNPQFIKLWPRIQTGFEADEKGMLHQLSGAQWLEDQAELAELERTQ
jgi:hypothetical protein